MQPKFSASSVPLSRLLADPFQLETPDYQRPFSWGEDEATRLLDDLCLGAEALIEPTDEPTMDEHFLGTVLLVDPMGAPHGAGWPLTGPRRPFEVVDGLQRLTTLTILLCVLRDVAADADETLDARVADCITAASTGRPRLRLRGTCERFFQTEFRLRTATASVPEESLPLPEQRLLRVRAVFADRVQLMSRSERAALVSFLLDHVFVVLVVTSGIDRAHRMFMVLNELGKPLARNDILKADCLGRASTADAGRIAEIWHALEARLGGDFESLFSHVRAMYGRPGGTVIAGIRTIADAMGGPLPFVANVLAPTAEALDDILKARTARWSDPAIGQQLAYLNWLPAKDWLPPLLLYWQRDVTAAEMLAFMAALDRFAFGLKVLGMGTSKRASRFAALATALRNGDQVLASPGGPLSLTVTEERSIRYNLRDLHARSAVLAKLALLRLNDAIAGSPQHLDPASFTVEHVLPRKHAPDGQWRQWFEDPADRDACTESLGNLILVTKAQNDKASNQELAFKQSVYFAPGAPALPLNETLRGRREWRPADVRAREDALFSTLDTIWGFGLATASSQPAPRRRQA